MKRGESLRGRPAFDGLFASGHRLEGKRLRCLWMVRPAERGSLRVAFVVPGRLATAVRRNRVRRLMRAAFDRERDTIFTQIRLQGIGLWLLFLFRPGSPVDLQRLSLADVYPDIAALCGTVRGMLRDHSS